MPANLLAALARRHGTRAPIVLGDARGPADLGAHFGDTLYAAEVDYLVAHEWAVEADDVLWRRTKCALHLRADERDTVAAYLRDLALRGGHD
jgi:glycerol-3-phosphate dehydrogenase